MRCRISQGQFSDPNEIEIGIRNDIIYQSHWSDCPFAYAIRIAKPRSILHSVGKISTIFFIRGSWPANDYDMVGICAHFSQQQKQRDRVGELLTALEQWSSFCLLIQPVTVRCIPTGRALNVETAIFLLNVSSSPHVGSIGRARLLKLEDVGVVGASRPG